MITDKLLGEVLNDQTVHNAEIFPRIVRYSRIENEEIIVPNCKINIHELVYKCKIWSISKGYAITELAYGVNIWDLNTNKICKTIKQDKTTFSNDDVNLWYDPKIVIKAAQWVSDNEN